MPVSEHEEENSNKRNQANTQKPETELGTGIEHQADGVVRDKPQTASNGQTAPKRKKWVSAFTIGDFATLTLALFQALLFIVTIFQLRVAQRSANDAHEALRDTHIAALAARDSAETARESLELTQAAALIVESKDTINFNDAQAEATIVNVGETAAEDIVTFVQGIPSESPNLTEEQIDTHPLGNSAKQDRITRSTTSPLGFYLKDPTRLLAQALPDGQNIYFYLRILIQYSDVFKKPHQTNFCELYVGNNKLVFNNFKECPHKRSS